MAMETWPETRPPRPSRPSIAAARPESRPRQADSQLHERTCAADQSGGLQWRRKAVVWHSRAQGGQGREIDQLFQIEAVQQRSHTRGVASAGIIDRRPLLMIRDR